MSRDISALMNTIIQSKKQNLLSYFDGETDFIFDEEYDRCFLVDIPGGLIYQDSSRGTNPYSGTESLIDQDSGKKLWICDYTGSFTQSQSFDAAYIYPLLKSGRLLYLDTCDGGLFADISHEDDGYIYMTKAEGSIKSMLLTETIYSDAGLVFTQLSNCMLKV